MHSSLTMWLPQQILLIKGRLLTLKHVNKDVQHFECGVRAVRVGLNHSCSAVWFLSAPGCSIRGTGGCFASICGTWVVLVSMSGLFNTPAHLGPGPSWHSHLVLWDRPVLTAQQMFEAFSESFMFVVEDSSLKRAGGVDVNICKNTEICRKYAGAWAFPFALDFPSRKRAVHLCLGSQKPIFLLKHQYEWTALPTSLWKCLLLLPFQAVSS